MASGSGKGDRVWGPPSGTDAGLSPGPSQSFLTRKPQPRGPCPPTPRFQGFVPGGDTRGVWGGRSLCSCSFNSRNVTSAANAIRTVREFPAAVLKALLSP